MKRKDFLKKGLIGTAAGLTLASCAGSQTTPAEEGVPNIPKRKKYRWKMVTAWPPNFPVLGEASNYFAQWLGEITDGAIDIKVYGGGELVPALEAFNTVSSGTAEVGSGAAYYWAGKSPAMPFFAAVPFGMNAAQMQSWFLGGEGEGMELMREMYGRFDLVPFLGGCTGVQMGGWFNKEINTADDFKGLKMRIPGIAGLVLEKAGGSALLVAGGEIYTSLERGVIDAIEWVGPYHDEKMGFHKIAKYYYYPGWQEPNSQLDFFVNKKVFEGLPKDLQVAIETVALRVNAWTLAEFDAQNGEYLEKIIDSGVELREFPDEVLEVLRKYTEEVLEETIGSDAFARRVYESYKNHMNKVGKWSELTEKAYYSKIQKIEDSFLG